LESALLAPGAELHMTVANLESFARHRLAPFRADADASVIRESRPQARAPGEDRCLELLGQNGDRQSSPGG
jgi:hypothetical protein